MKLLLSVFLLLSLVLPLSLGAPHTGHPPDPNCKTPSNTRAVVRRGRQTEMVKQDDSDSGYDLLTVLHHILESGDRTDCQKVAIVSDASEFMPLFWMLLEREGLFLFTSEGNSILPDDRHTCRVVLVDDRTEEFSGISSRILAETMSVRKFPHTMTVVGIGSSEEQASSFLMQEELGNTVHPFYLVTSSSGISVFRRCLYCYDGHPKAIELTRFRNGRPAMEGIDYFPNELSDFHGRTLLISALPWFPFASFTANSSKEGRGRVFLADSITTRMLKTMTKVMNFTFEVYNPGDLTWGRSTESGNWTGIVGEVQHEIADFGIVMSLLHERLPVIDYPNVYLSEPLIPVTRKALPLPAYLAPARPFDNTVWAVLFLTSLVGGFFLGLASLLQGYFREELPRNSWSDSVLASWSILFQNPLGKLPTNSTMRILVGFLWVFCMIVAITYKSSLIAHLSIPGKSPTLETLAQVVKARGDGWTLGYEDTYGSGWEWLATNTNPTVKQAYEMVQVMTVEDNMKKVMAGNHMFLTFKYYIQSIIQTRYTRDTYTPLHVSKTEYFNYGGYTFGCRKGAPFRNRFDMATKRMREAGLISFWMDELLRTSARNKRKEGDQQEIGGNGETNLEDESGRLLVLSLDHLQAAFYILAMGCLLAIFVFGAEIGYSRIKASQSKKMVAMDG